jgi:hypothetical protein
LKWIATAQDVSRSGFEGSALLDFNDGFGAPDWSAEGRSLPNGIANDSVAFGQSRVFLGDAVARRVPLRIVRGIAAAIFAGLGLLTLLNVGDFI